MSDVSNLNVVLGNAVVTAVTVSPVKTTKQLIQSALAKVSAINNANNSISKAALVEHIMETAGYSKDNPSMVLDIEAVYSDQMPRDIGIVTMETDGSITREKAFYLNIEAPSTARDSKGDLKYHPKFSRIKYYKKQNEDGEEKQNVLLGDVKASTREEVAASEFHAKLLKVLGKHSDSYNKIGFNVGYDNALLTKLNEYPPNNFPPHFLEIDLLRISRVLFEMHPENSYDADTLGKYAKNRLDTTKAERLKSRNYTRFTNEPHTGYEDVRYFELPLLDLILGFIHPERGYLIGDVKNWAIEDAVADFSYVFGKPVQAIKKKAVVK